MELNIRTQTLVFFEKCDRRHYITKSFRQLRSSDKTGLSTVKLWSREPVHADKHERNYQTLPMEDKYAYK